uniref:Uncharacterized protein n=1 Tax=Sinocyclocheilus rhinocerous TaxID=307959 RepID=A0A673FM07_9TELE
MYDDSRLHLPMLKAALSFVREHTVDYSEVVKLRICMERWEQELREAGSLDELLMLTEYPDWKLWRCRLKLKHFEYATPPENRRSTRYAAASTFFSD